MFSRTNVRLVYTCSFPLLAVRLQVHSTFTGEGLCCLQRAIQAWNRRPRWVGGGHTPLRSPISFTLYPTVAEVKWDVSSLPVSASNKLFVRLRSFSPPSHQLTPQPTNHLPESESAGSQGGHLNHSPKYLQTVSLWANPSLILFH